MFSSGQYPPILNMDHVFIQFARRTKFKLTFYPTRSLFSVIYPSFLSILCEKVVKHELQLREDAQQSVDF